MGMHECAAIETERSRHSARDCATRLTACDTLKRFSRLRDYMYGRPAHNEPAEYDRGLCQFRSARGPGIHTTTCRHG